MKSKVKISSRLLVIFALLFVFAAPVNANTEIGLMSAVTAVEASAPATEAPEAAITPSAGDVKAPDVGDVVAASQDLKGKKGIEFYIGLALFLSILFKFLMDLLKKLSPFFNNKRVIRIATLVAFLSIVMLDQFVISKGNWMLSIIAGFAGPGSLYFNELLKIFRSGKE